MEFLKSSTIKEGLNVYSYPQPENMLKLCLNFNEFQPMYADERYDPKQERIRNFHQISLYS